jgi:hypothetical protein
MSKKLCPSLMLQQEQTEIPLNIINMVFRDWIDCNILISLEMLWENIQRRLSE